MSINQQEEALFQDWSNALEVTMDEFVSDGLLFHDGLIFDGANWVRTCSGNNTEIWNNSSRRLLIITRDQPSDDGNVWDVRGETPYSPDGYSLKKIPMLKCLIPWAYASLLYDNETQGMCPKDEISKIGFWMTAPIARINVSVSAMQPCSASFNSLPLPREYNITNMTAAKRYESVWNAFLNELSHNPTATLTSFLKRCNVRQGRMKRWMENNGLSVKEAKKRLRDCRHDGIGDPMPPLSEDSGSLFLPMATDKPAPRSESCDILSGVSLTFPDGTQVNIKRGSAQAVMSFLKLYQREDLPCLD